jgi:hypothetical protein
MKFRKLRIAWTVGCAIACVLLIVVWVRSYWIADSLGISQSCNLAAYRGEFVVGILDDKSGFFNIVQGHSRNELSDENESWDIRRVATPTWSIIAAHGEALPGSFHFIVIEFYALLAVPLIAGLAAAPWPKRFSLRTLLVATTLVALVLGLIVYVSRQ